MSALPLSNSPPTANWERDPVTTAPLEYYSAEYSIARRRFVDASQRLGMSLHSYPIQAPGPTDEPLTIDIAVAGASRPETALVLSSGVHGVEGFFGSAVQLAYLASLPTGWQPPPNSALIVVHSLNPFGFAWRRRFNEDNVDLNRNFLLADQEYAGAPPLAATFRRAMAPGLLGMATARTAYLALRYGIRSFWETLPVGQYEFPDWLWFGGRSRAKSVEALEQLLLPQLEAAAEVIHLDFHTGLGRWSECQLLLSGGESSEGIAWWRSHFAGERVKPPGTAKNYSIRGGVGPWLQSRLPDCRYRFATAEFGTYSAARVMRALVDELRWHARLGTQAPQHRFRRRLAEVFVPKSIQWRTKTLIASLSLVEQAADLLWRAPAVKASDGLDGLSRSR